MPPTHDTRLLSFNAWTKDAASASAALSAWAVADSGDTQDLMDISIRISQLLSTCSTSQRHYIHALSAYRTSLKDVLERETGIRTVLRDREILVSRLIKLGNKKPADSALNSHQLKVTDAQRELAACEAFLQDEESALSGVKRRTFREALAMRMKAMGELGRTMEECANEAVEILSQLGQSSDYPAFLRQASAAGDAISLGGDSITPSHSASQALSRSSSASSLLSQDVGPKITDNINIEPSSPKPNGAPPALAPVHRGASLPVIPIPTAPPPTGAIQRASTIASRRAQSPVGPASVQLGSIPAAPRGITVGPSMVIPKAPAHVSTRGPNDDSSDEEGDLQGYRSGALDGGVGPRSSAYGVAPPPAAGVGRLRKKALSESGDSDAGRKRRSGFFGGIAALFRKKEKKFAIDEDDDDDDSMRHSRFRPSPVGGGWETRTDRNLKAVRGRSVIGVGGRRPGDSESSDEDDRSRNLVKVVNDPAARIRAFSEAGKTPSLAPTNATTKPKVRKVKKAASDIGVSTVRSARPVSTAAVPRPASMATSPRPVSTATAPHPVLRLAPPMAAPSPVPASPMSWDEASSPVVKKKKRKVIEPTQTLVITATPDMLSTPTMPSSPKLGRSDAVAAPAAVVQGSLSRSNTVTTNGTVKKKKKRVPLQTVASLAAQPATTPPTVEDLAQSLPSARTSMYAAYPAIEPPPTPTLPTSEDKPGKVPKSVGEAVKRTRRESIKYGNQTWVSNPVVGGPGHIADESLMTIVDRDQKDETAETSRTYTGKKVEEAEEAEEAGEAGVAASRTLEPANGALVKRKSVRLAEGPAPPPAQSPPSSVRSDTLTAPRHGILVNHLPPSPPPPDVVPSHSHLGPPAGWDTRVSTGTGTAAQDSSDEDDEDEGYKAAKKAFVKGTKGFTKVLTAEMKGKGRAE